MKEINLISLKNANKTLSQELFKSYLNYFSIGIKSSEIEDLKSLIYILQSTSKNQLIFDNYFIGFSIPQIGKEFDLLRIGKEEIVNIELKRTSSEEKILKQLLKNKYYLSFLPKKKYFFTYVSDIEKIFKLNEYNELIEIEVGELCQVLLNQNINKLDNIENLFNPSDYLVSPFNSTNEFINGEYFLTIHQETIKNEILNISNSKKVSFCSIKGKAGSGKTLLTYDIAKEFILLNKNVLIIHCGQLNEGHNKLNKNSNWNIIPAKHINNCDFSKYQIIIIDECQRIYPSQLEIIINEIYKNEGMCVFSYDSKQYLRSWESSNDIEKKLKEISSIKMYELTTKIRTNREISSFINCLFDKTKPKEKHKFSNINLNYFNDYSHAKNYIYQLKNEGWKAINYTPSTKRVFPYENHKIEDENDNSHTIIGQEFDNVIAVIDPYFYYKNNLLSTRNYVEKPYYHPTKMLFQIVTRTRKQLNIIIINNDEVLEHCLSILQN